MKLWKDYKPTGSAGGVTIKLTWPFFDLLTFLDPFMRHVKTKSNYSELLKEEKVNLCSDIVSSNNQFNRPYSQILTINDPVAENEIFKATEIKSVESDEQMLPFLMSTPITTSAFSVLKDQDSQILVLNTPKAQADDAKSAQSKRKQKKINENDDHQDILNCVKNANDVIIKSIQG